MHAKSEGKIASVLLKIRDTQSLSIRKLAAQVEICHKTIYFCEFILEKNAPTFIGALKNSFKK